MLKKLRALMNPAPGLPTMRCLRPGRRRRGTCGGFLPRLELLEGRSLPSTYSVLNLADSGAGSLRQAVIDSEANPGADVINFAHNVHGTITLTSGELGISSDLTINGPGAHRLTVSGNDASRIFDVVGGGDESSRISVSFSGLTLTHGRALLFGGGVENQSYSSLLLSHMTLVNNECASEPGARRTGGGAVANRGAGARLTIADSIMTGNKVTATSGLVGFGGAILSFLGSSLTVTNSMITGNQVSAGPDVDADGGGITATGLAGSSLIVRDSIIADNRVASGAGFTFARGGGIDAAVESAMISHCTITGNEAFGGPENGVGDGGGIITSSDSATITASLLRGNRAVGGDGGGHANGGAILNLLGSLSVTDCTLSANRAIGGDGGDDGQAIGGAVANYYFAFLSISNSILERNGAIAGNGAFLTSDEFTADSAFGGAIANQYDSRLEISHTTLRGNQAIGGNNAVMESSLPEAGGADGGAINNSLGGIALIRDSVIENNQALGGNGNRANGLIALAGEAVGGGINNSIDGAFLGFGPNQLTVINSVIAHNEAIGGNGNTSSSAAALVGAGLGGGIANYLGATANIENSTISHNRAVGGTGNISNHNAAPAGLGAGGAIFNALGNFVLDTGDVLAPSIVNITDTTLEHNQARGGEGSHHHRAGDGWGGTIANLFDATTNVAGSTLAHNLAEGGEGNSPGNGFGGGAYNDEASFLQLTDSTVTRNRARGGEGECGSSDGQGIGGGIYNLGLFLLDDLTVIALNHASTSDDDIFGPYLPI